MGMKDDSSSPPRQCLELQIKGFLELLSDFVAERSNFEKSSIFYFRHVYLCNNENSLGSESSLYHDRIFVTVDISNFLRYENNGTYNITLHNECL